MTKPTLERPPEWHAQRRESIGASEVSTILGFNPYQSEYELWALKTDQIEPFGGNEATRLGQRLEPIILDEAEYQLGELSRDVRVPHKSVPLTATLDAQVNESGDVVEAKTAGLVSGFTRDEWGDPGETSQNDLRIPSSYFLQVQAQLACTQQELGFLFAWIVSRGIVRYEITSDKHLQDDIVRAVDLWWNKHIVHNEPPSLVGTSREVLGKIPRTADAIELDQTAIALADLRKALKDEESRNRKRIKSVEEELIQLLGTAECGILPDGRLLSFKEQSRDGYTVKPSTYRTLRIGKAK